MASYSNAGNPPPGFFIINNSRQNNYHAYRSEVFDGIEKKVFLTGAPSSGKTTAIKKIIAQLKHPANSFFTREEKLI